MYVYDIREGGAGEWHVVRVDLDSGRADYVRQYPTEAEAEARAYAAMRNRMDRRW